MKPYLWLLRSVTASSLLALGCTDFPSIPSGECGNRVIEALEDCDFFAPERGTVCRPKGSVGECHFDCTAHDGARIACPAGWGCDGDAICRQPTGSFEEPTTTPNAGAWALATGDFDADGHSDVMSLEPLDSAGATRLRFYYFDAQAALQESHDFPKLVLSPVIRDISGDGLSDVAFTTGAIGVLLGRKDRAWVPETFSSYPLLDARLRVVPVFNDDIQTITPLAALVSTQSGTGFFSPDVHSGKLLERAAFDGTIADLAGDPVSGNLLEDPSASPCLEPVLAARGASHFTVVNTCVTENGAVTWRDQFELQMVELEPRAGIDQGPLIVDMNADGHLDVLVGAAGGVYVSYGDGHTLSVATPYRLSLSNDPAEISPDIPMPLAAADFTGDGALDFVFPTHLLVSSKPQSGQLPRYFVGAVNPLSAPWTIAKIADFNGNGKLDVVAASSAALNIDFYNGTGTPNFSATTISTGAIQALAVGDYDADSIADLALIERPSGSAMKSSVLVTFGAPFVPLGTPAIVGQVPAPEQMCSVEAGGIASLAITSAGATDGLHDGALTLMDGSADRIPFAPYVLTEFSSSGSISNSVAFAVAAGSFSAPGQGDVMALAFPDIEQTQLWLLSSIESSPGGPTRVPDDLSSNLTPTTFGKIDFTADVSSCSADLDGDGRDEAIFAMPAGVSRDQCGVLTVGASTQGQSPVAARKPVLIAERCTDPTIVPVDADGDGWVDLALLTGAASGSDRKLYVLWNDKHGGFAASLATQVPLGADSPQAFTVLPASLARPIGLAYVANGMVNLVTTTSEPRTFSAPITLAQIDALTGIVASDVNGDGVVDLVLAASGELSVLKARLWVP